MTTYDTSAPGVHDPRQWDAPTDLDMTGAMTITDATQHAPQELHRPTRRTRRRRRNPEQPAETPAAEAQPAETVPPVASESELGEVAVVYSPKGGVGTTTVAVNLAHALHDGGRRAVCLVDLDVEFGDVALATGLLPSRTVADAVGVDLDDAVLPRLVVPRVPGLDCVLAPADPVSAETITPEVVTALLTALRARYDYVVVDTSSQLGECTLEALVGAQHLVLVSNPELAALKNLRVALDVLDLVGADTARRTVVLNRCRARATVSTDDVLGVLRVPAVREVPDHADVVQSLDDGVPLRSRSPRHPVSVAVSALATEIAGEPPTVTAPKHRARLRPLRRTGA